MAREFMCNMQLNIEKGLKEGWETGLFSYSLDL